MVPMFYTDQKKIFQANKDMPLFFTYQPTTDTSHHRSGLPELIEKKYNLLDYCEKVEKDYY